MNTDPRTSPDFEAPYAALDDMEVLGLHGESPFLDEQAMHRPAQFDESAPTWTVEQRVAFDPIARMLALLHRLPDDKRSKLESIILRALIRAGNRNEADLTDRIFQARHPELGGRSVTAGQKDLATEWLRIRDDVVRPLLGGVAPTPASAYDGPPPQISGDAATLAARILQSSKIQLGTSNQVSDGADARANLVDTAAGRMGKRSSYGNAPGGTAPVQSSVLQAMLQLTAPPYSYSFYVGYILGGSHSSTSRHYVGVAMDVSIINGVHVSSSHPQFRPFMQACRDLGATEVLGPGSAGHDTHIHAAWPRPTGEIPEHEMLEVLEVMLDDEAAPPSIDLDRYPSLKAMATSHWPHVRQWFSIAKGLANPDVTKKLRAIISGVGWVLNQLGDATDEKLAGLEGASYAFVAVANRLPIPQPPPRYTVTGRGAYIRSAGEVRQRLSPGEELLPGLHAMDKATAVNLVYATLGEQLFRAGGVLPAMVRSIAGTLTWPPH
jgi:hypothetical protein